MIKKPSTQSAHKHMEAPLYILPQHVEGIFAATVESIKRQDRADSRYPGEFITPTFRLDNGVTYSRDCRPDPSPGSLLTQMAKHILARETGEVYASELEGRRCRVEIEKRTTQDGQREYYTVARVLSEDSDDDGESSEAPRLFGEDDGPDAGSAVDLEGEQADEEAPVPATTQKIVRPMGPKKHLPPPPSRV